jgi:hypothetical protein
MPKRKQKSILKTKDATGQPLAKRKRWYSHGVERQAARDAATVEQEANSLRYAQEEAQIEQWLQWDENDARHEDDRNDAFYDRYTDALAAHLTAMLARRLLLDVAPDSLRRRWQSQRPEAEAVLERQALEARIESPWQDSETLKQQAQQATGSLTNISLINQVCARENNAPCAMAIVYLAPLWIRQPATFTGTTLRALIDHLFVAYPVPEVLYRAWPGPYQTARGNDKWRQWFLCFAQGGSLYKLGQLAQGWEVSKRFAHQFAQHSGTESIHRAAIETELGLLGVSHRAAELLFACEPYLIDVTAVWGDYDRRFLAHWRDTVRWIDRNIDELDPGLVAYLLNWSYRQVRVHNREFSWAGRTVDASIAHANTYFESQGRPYARWKKLDMDWASTDGWSVVELGDTTELTREGMALSHCVGGYGQVCKSGRSAIFSLRYQEKPMVTIQLDPATGQIQQALGNRNRACSEEEMGQIKAWLVEAGTFAGKA